MGLPLAVLVTFTPPFVCVPPKNGHFLESQSAIEMAGRLETAPNLCVVVRICLLVALSYGDAGFVPLCNRKDFWITCCFLLRAARCC